MNQHNISFYRNNNPSFKGGWGGKGEEQRTLTVGTLMTTSTKDLLSYTVQTDGQTGLLRQPPTISSVCSSGHHPSSFSLLHFFFPKWGWGGGGTTSVGPRRQRRWRCFNPVTTKIKRIDLLRPQWAENSGWRGGDEGGGGQGWRGGGCGGLGMVVVKGVCVGVSFFFLGLTHDVFLRLFSTVRLSS